MIGNYMRKLYKNNKFTLFPKLITQIGTYCNKTDVKYTL